MKIRYLEQRMGGIIAIGLLTAACQKTNALPETALLALSQADRIELSTPAQAVSAITDPSQIDRISSFLQRYRRGWVIPPYGQTPRPELILRFFRAGNYLDAIGVGRGFLAAGEGYSRVQPLPDSQRKEFIDLLSLEEHGGLTPPDQPAAERNTLVDPGNP